MCARFIPVLLTAYLLGALLPFFTESAVANVPGGAILICTPNGAKIVDPATGEERRIVHRGHQCCCPLSGGKDIALAVHGIPLAGGAYEIFRATLLGDALFRDVFSYKVSSPRAPPASLLP